MASSRFWGKRALPDELRRASIRWGKRWDAKAWRQMYSELLRPTNIVSSKWTPAVRTDEDSKEPFQEMEVWTYLCHRAKAKYYSAEKLSLFGELIH
ncbi:hypothetical protein ANCCAN_00086 [Ancylostoma caninum]|uniref:Uncharacterized protein n=1 Tax=Ancylostoma caninum TaxID=29170 RepID=A0A368HAG0_ANCCA|nr:hypothetical protein ANCCAN_00086 [Ancylostoma caninum]